MENFLQTIRPYFDVILALCIAIPAVVAWIVTRMLYKQERILVLIPAVLLAAVLVFGILVHCDMFLPTTGLLGELIILFGGIGLVSSGMSILYCYVEKLWNEKRGNQE